MNWKKILILFLIWRFVDFLIIYFAPKFIPYLGFFPYKDQLVNYHLPGWISSLANFDGLHYVLIAKNSYSQFEQAFFPLYPLLIRFLSPLFFNNQLLAGLIISNVSFLLGLWFFVKYLKIGNLKSKIWSLIFLILFPTSFFFGAVYTEGLFFLLVILSLYFLKKNKYLLVIFFTFLASLTRLMGIFLIIPIIFNFIEKNKRKKLLLLVFAPILGLGLYCFYLLKTTGDPLYFLTTQPLFGANRSTHLIFLPQVYWRYFKIFFTAALNSRYFTSVIEFLIFTFVFGILTLDLIKNCKLKIINWGMVGLNLFSFSNLILPTLTGTFSSIPRYSLLSISFFIYLSEIKNNFIKTSILIIFFLLHIILLGLFRQGYFIS
jgi:Gpi18-like mannosyltransferase